MDKRAYYQDQRIVDNYDDWRFGSGGGSYVDKMEKFTFIEFLSKRKDARILDMPCGTGRLLRALRDHGYEKIEGADASPAMLELAAVHLPGVELREVDAMLTPYADDRFDCVCCLRFLFHIPRPEPLFAEVFRLLKEGGVFVFDSLAWTPRNAIPFLNRWLGGQLYPYGRARLEQLLRQQGFEMVEVRPVFLLPTQVYRFLPEWGVALVRRLEKALPKSCRSKLIVKARKVVTPVYAEPPRNED